MIPIEIGEPSLHRELYDLTHNHQNMATHLDLLPELKEKAQIHNLAAKQRAVRKYNANLCPRWFIKGDLVWRMASSARKKDANSPPIGTAHTGYVKTLGEADIGWSNCLGKKYPLLGMWPISSFTSVKNMYCIAPKTCNPACTLFPHLVFFP